MKRALLLVLCLASLFLLTACPGTMPHNNTAKTNYEIDARLLERCESKLPELTSKQLTDVLIALDKGAGNYADCADRQSKLSAWVCKYVLKTEECAK